MTDPLPLKVQEVWPNIQRLNTGQSTSFKDITVDDFKAIKKQCYNGIYLLDFSPTVRLILLSLLTQQTGVLGVTNNAPLRSQEGAVNYFSKVFNAGCTARLMQEGLRGQMEVGTNHILSGARHDLCLSVFDGNSFDPLPLILLDVFSEPDRYFDTSSLFEEHPTLQACIAVKYWPLSTTRLPGAALTPQNITTNTKMPMVMLVYTPTESSYYYFGSMDYNAQGEGKWKFFHFESQMVGSNPLLPKRQKEVTDYEEDLVIRLDANDVISVNLFDLQKRILMGFGSDLVQFGTTVSEQPL